MVGVGEGNFEVILGKCVGDIIKNLDPKVAEEAPSEKRYAIRARCRIVTSVYGLLDMRALNLPARFVGGQGRMIWAMLSMRT